VAARRVDHQVAAVRRFNRFYTRKIGVLRERAYRSPFSITAVRVLYELAHRDESTATELGAELALDAGYLSRILRDLADRGLIAKRPAPKDRRQSLLVMTSRGRKVFAPLDARSSAEVGAMLRDLSSPELARLLEAMRTIEQLLGERADTPPVYLLRAPEPGDLGWVVHRHGVLYAQEYGYDEQFEALVAEVVAGFLRHHDAKRERCWIAEQEGAIVGSVFVVAQSATVAQLRLLYVEPRARGLGIGGRLVAECIRFARQAGYQTLALWTQSELGAARRLYEAAGFHVVHTERHKNFGRELVAETWELNL
jgi:DNA-binding MarR family transcriptional regulator/N-acetylglutamate synthase-like GNAT family acetyltransferase